MPTAPSSVRSRPIAPRQIAAALQPSPKRRSLALTAAYLVVFSCGLTALAQLGVIYFSLFRAHAAGEEPSMLHRGLAWSPLIIAGLSCLHWNQLLARVPVNLSILVGLAGLNFLVGLALSPTHSVTNYYILADSLRYSTAWFSFYMLLRAFETIRRQGGEELLQRCADEFCKVAVFDAAATVALASMYRGAHFSTGTFVYGTIWAILRDKSTPVRRAMILGICLAASVLEGKRTTLGMSGFAIAASCGCLFVTGRAKQILSYASAGVVILALAACCVDWRSEAIQDQIRQINDGWQSLFDSATGHQVDTTLEYRYNEIATIRNYFESANPLWTLTGLGFGAEIDAGWLDVGGSYTASGNLHHAHNSFAIYFFRHGLLGVSLLVVFILSVVLMPIRSVRASARDVVACAWIFSIALLMAGYTGNLMLESVDLPFVTALTLILAQRPITIRPLLKPGGPGRATRLAIRSDRPH